MLLEFAVFYHVVLFSLAAYAYHKRDEKVWLMALLLGFTLFLNGSAVSVVDDFNNIALVPIDAEHAVTLMLSLICTLYFITDLIENNEVARRIAVQFRLKKKRRL